MCLYPRLIDNPKYRPNKKNKGRVPQVKDPRVKLVPVGCGKCIECRKAKAREWRIRLLEEIKGNKTKSYFVTLTFNNESWKELAEEIKGLEGYELDNEIAKIGIQKFTNRWKKEFKNRPRRWFITELGENNTERIHVHGIVWTEHGSETITKKWKYGNTYIGEYVNEKTINYIVKYLHKTDMKHKEYIPKIFTSNGIGSNYRNSINFENNKYKPEGTNENYRMYNGYKMAMPIYYRNLLYNDDEKEKLWIEKLDKGERFVLGQKINIKKNFDEYDKMLIYAQRKNKEWGYGDNSINWDRKIYERNLRKLKHDEIRNAKKNK